MKADKEGKWVMNRKKVISKGNTRKKKGGGEALQVEYKLLRALCSCSQSEQTCLAHILWLHYSDLSQGWRWGRSPPDCPDLPFEEGLEFLDPEGTGHEDAECMNQES